MIWLGLAGCALAITRLYDRTVMTAAVAGLGLFAFLVLGATGLPLLSRYLLLPAALLALWCAVAAVGFTVPGATGRVWVVSARRRVRRPRRGPARLRTSCDASTAS